LLGRNATNVGTASDVPLNHSFGFKFGIRIRYRGAVYAELRGQLAARRDSVTRSELAGMDQGAKLIAQLNVKRYVAFGL
jgi:hypothetical protein